MLNEPTTGYAPYAVEADTSPRQIDDGSETAGRSTLACDSCSGTGWALTEGKGARPCGCRLQGRRARRFEESCIPALYREATLKSYQPDRRNLSQMRALAYAHTLVRDYPKVDQGILFQGTIGVGKTHLAAAILIGLIEKGIACRFYEYRTLLKNIQESYNPSTRMSEMDVLAPLFESQVVVLDELGALRPTEWVQDTLALIINARYSERKLTIFTTNYFDERLTDADETLEDRIGVRVRSRLYQMCKTVLIEGDDWRRQFNR
jgi:DNA replication protein DnaC